MGLVLISTKIVLGKSGWQGARLVAVPDFPRTIFIEFQTNIMSADGINYMATHRPMKIPLQRKIRTSNI